MVSILDSSITCDNISVTDLTLSTTQAGLFVAEAKNSAVTIQNCELSFKNVKVNRGFGLILSADGQKEI